MADERGLCRRGEDRTQSFTVQIFMTLGVVAFVALLLSCQTLPQVQPPPVSEAESGDGISDDAPSSYELGDDALTNDFVVSEELFAETLFQVERTIGELDVLIRDKDYARWLGYLSRDYQNFYSNADELARLSESRRMRSAGIILRSIEDFFFHVVVPSRVNVRLDDLLFKSETEVEAIMFIQDQRLSVYRLQLINKQWKIIR